MRNNKMKCSPMDIDNRRERNLIEYFRKSSFLFIYI